MGAARAGKVAGAAGKSQHVDLYRKSLLRRGLLPRALPGPVYLPFCGDGDIAALCYPDRIHYGADLDEARVATAAQRFPSSTFVVGDCDAWPFAGLRELRFAVADLDAYVNPYLALVAFWGNTRHLDRVVIFGTDGMRLGLRMNRMKQARGALPVGKLAPATITVARGQYNAWWTRFVLPFVKTTVAPWRVTTSRQYMRDAQIYWGVVVER